MTDGEVEELIYYILHYFPEREREAKAHQISKKVCGIKCCRKKRRRGSS